MNRDQAAKPVTKQEPARPSAESFLPLQMKHEIAEASYPKQVQMLTPPVPAQMGGPAWDGGEETTVQMQAVQYHLAMSGTLSGTIPGTTGSLSVTPVLQPTDDPNNFTGSKGAYETNFDTVKGNISQRGGTPDQVSNFNGKKGVWYSRWGVAALQTDADAAKGEFETIRQDLVAIFPDDSPSSGGGHLYTGYAGGGSGRQRAEAMATTENANPTNQAAGLTHRTLERTLVGNLFDGVAQNKRDPNEQKLWIPYNGSQASQWWSQVSAAYANTFVGEVHAHVDIGLPYYVSKVGQGKTTPERQAMTAELQDCIKLHPSVFRDDELPRVATLMGEGKVTQLTVHLRVECAPGNIKTASPSIPGTSVANAAQLVDLINAQVRSQASVADILPNIT
ncbi:MAG: hypothetical protein JW797_09500 [Bradymonadales bacterium]|nr:hypothetical protein [Bradymonadales bacterium]